MLKAQSPSFRVATQLSEGSRGKILEVKVTFSEVKHPQVDSIHLQVSLQDSLGQALLKLPHMA